MAGTAAALLVHAAACASTGTLDRQRFEGIRAAGQAIQASIGASEKLSRYQELLTSYGAELSKLKGAATNRKEREVVAQYDALYAQFQDLRLVWEARTTRAAETDRLPLSDPLSERLAKQYSLPVNTNEPPSIYATEALNAIWTDAKASLERANAAVQP